MQEDILSLSANLSPDNFHCLSLKSRQFAKFTLKFEDSVEHQYMQSCMANDLWGFRMFYLALIIINPLMLFLDASRFEDPSASSLYTRLLPELVFIIVYIIGKRLTVKDTREFQGLVFIVTPVLYTLFLGSDYFIEQHFYHLFLPNITSILLFVNASFVGLRFRHSIILNSLTTLTYSLYATFLSTRPFHSHQVVYIIVFFFLVSIISYVFERKNRILFLKQELIARQNEIIEEKNEKLIKQNEMQTSLMSILTHDIRTPLGTLQELLKLKAKSVISEHGIIEHFNKISSSFEHTNELVDQMILWVKSQMDGFSPKKEPFILREIIGQTVALCQDAADKKDIRIVIGELSDEALTSDSEMFSIILRNLLMNAVKFSYKGSSVRVTAECDETTCQVSVSDTGIGIPEKKHQTIFSSTSTTRGTDNEKGTGMGLPLSHNLTQVLGGELTLESEEGKGSVFSLIFRLQD